MGDMGDVGDMAWDGCTYPVLMLVVESKYKKLSPRVAHVAHLGIGMDIPLG